MKHLVAVFCVLLLCSTTMFAQTATTPSGSGTSSDPFLIATLDNLYWLSQADTAWSKGYYYTQTADIDAGATRYWDGGAGFSPIGTDTTSSCTDTTKQFTGTYDGGYHKITNLYINRPSQNRVGLFGCVRVITVSCLGIVHCNITGGNDASYCGTGGLVGFIRNYSKGSDIEKCYTTGSVTGTNYVGGLVGMIGADTIKTLVANCFSQATVTGTKFYVGGLIGLCFYRAVVNRSYATGDVIVIGDTTNRYCAGGLIGSVTTIGKKNVSVYNCYATGNVTGSYFVGGLIGEATLQDTISYLNVWYCYATGNVSGNYYAGGLLGYTKRNINCADNYAAGTVSGSSNIGGLIGYHSEKALVGVSSSLYNSDHFTGTTSYGTGKTTAELKTQSTYSGFNNCISTKYAYDTTYGALVSSYTDDIDNAPFAFDDTITTASRTVTLSPLLANDCDYETRQQYLVLKVQSASAGTTDGATTLTLPSSFANGATDTIVYRVGEVRNWTNAVYGILNDTLWGNRATAYITLDTTATSVSSAAESVPHVFALNQNYPNPFNPTTTITFTLAQNGFTTLKIYDMLGREVAALVNGEMKAGIVNTVTFDASKLASGVYFSRLQSSGNAQIKKMVLMK